MKRVIGRAFFAGVIATSAVAFTPACADNDQSIFIRNVVAPPQNRQNGSCLYSADPSQAGLFDGVLDVGATDNYVAVVLVGSQLIGRGNPDAVRAESNRAHINGAVVTVLDPNGAELGSFTSLASGSTDIQQNNVPSYGVASVTLIDPPTSAKIAAGLTAGGPSKLVMASVKMFGKTIGGVDLESGEFQFPIRVCRGCLISFASGDDPATENVVECKNALDSASGATLPCKAGQDEGTPCQVCSPRPDCVVRQF